MAGEITVGGNILASHTGIDGAGSLTLGNTVAPSSSYMFRNKIINGNFDIWQRGTSQTNSGYGNADRWQNYHETSTKTASQQAFTLGQTEVPGNPKYYLRHVITTGGGANDRVLTNQRIEDVSVLAGKTFTFSFWAKADSAKNIAIEVVQNFGTGGSPTSAITGIGVTTHSLTTSWQKFTGTISIPSISGKTIGTNGNDYTSFAFWFDAGSTYNSRTNSLGNQSGTFDIAQVQLEEGEVATPFEQRPYGLELSLCQRYYQQMWLSCISRDYNRRAHIFHNFIPNMRIKPSAKVYSKQSSESLNKVSGYSSGTEYTIETISLFQGSIGGTEEGVPVTMNYVQCPSGSSFPTEVLWGRFTFDAEL